MKTKLLYKIAFLTAYIFMAGCSEEWLDERPPHLISTESLYTSLAGFETGLNGMYVLARQEKEGEEDERSYGGSNQLRYELSATGTDVLCANRLDRFSNLATYWGEINSPENPHLQSHFIWLYRVINSANTIINNAESRTDVDWRGYGVPEEENKNRVIGEAKAVRAWAYRHLTFMWGDVPLSRQESLGSTIRTDWARTPVEEVRLQMISDLLFAEKSVPVEPLVRGKITKGAVQHYLAELYLVLDKPDSALYWADKVIDTPQYSLITERFGVNSSNDGTPFADMFLDGNANRDQGNIEALWVWQWGYYPGGGRNIMRRWTGSEYNKITVGGKSGVLTYTVERGGRPQARFSMTKFALDLYESQDDRFADNIVRKYFTLKDESQNAPWAADKLPDSTWHYGDTIWLNWDREIELSPSFQPYLDWPYSSKFDHSDPINPTSTESNKDAPYLRLAETYLIKAEAELLLGKTGSAANTINVLRNRANASDITAGEVDIDFILDERSRELIFEEHRRYTLLRTGKWLERTRLHNKNGGQNISERDVLFPIPQTVIDANLTSPMLQNPGWD
ncbi:MAG: RagB/SusD family nutrient uptake outer membrane protein [Bacteroidales bacterium]|nr:RagB/SusD family nutrient uptake outer membrane protein [Bacteroidales bacterium]